jgi:uncharacterized protein (DUF983 family)
VTIRPVDHHAGTPPLPSIWQALGRGLTRRCPRCGQGRLFVSWFRIRERCPRCALPLEREEGALLGSISLNYGVTGLVFIVSMALWIALSAPDLDPVVALAVGLPIVVVVPTLFFPFSKTIWAAVDLLLRRMDREDRDEAWGPQGRT